MHPSRIVLCASAVLCLLPLLNGQSQSPATAPEGPTFEITSNLVFLDATVIDKKGDIVTSGLTRDDFTITEDNKPQPIFSFEPPQAHAADSQGETPSTIIVIDLLNSSFQDSSYIRYEVEQFLNKQPAQLAAPAKLMVIGNDSLEMVQGYTRNRADLLDALHHIPAALPYKEMSPSFFWERFAQSLDALQQIALMNKGVPGRKNVIWIGHGGPGILLDDAVLTQPVVNDLQKYVHATANMLVDARITLFVIYPGLKVGGNVMSLSAQMSENPPSK
jgi:VWFA-related protein